MFKILNTLRKTVQITHKKSPQPQVLFSIRKFCSKPEINSQTEEVLSLNDELLNALSGGDETLKHKLQVLVLEAEVLRQEGQGVPSASYMKEEHWRELLAKPTRSQRKKFLDFLFKNEMRKYNRDQEKKERREKFLARPPVLETDHLRYDLGHNNIFLRFYDSTINNFYNYRLLQALQFGQKLVIDCGYGKNMNQMENSNCAKQLMLLFANNRYHDDPYDLHFCNMDRENTLHRYLHKHIPTMYDSTFPMNIHQSNYLDLFPKNQLVYLTPHCREELIEYDHDAVYIIGALVDKVNNEPLSLAKAKKEGLRMAKLPLDKYLMWGSGSGKSLTLNQVLNIMLDMKHTNDWQFALRHVPKRKLMDEKEIEELRIRQRHKENKYNKNMQSSQWKPKSYGEDPRNNRQTKSRVNISSILQD